MEDNIENNIGDNIEINVKENFIKNAKERGDRVLVFSDKGDVVFDTEGFDHTRITDAKLIVEGKIVPLERITTWAGLLRSVNSATKEQRDKEDIAEECFNSTIAEVVDAFDLGMNQNFSMTLFKDDSFIKSSIYRNNQNHALEVWRDKKICAVYAGEVVVVLNALIASSGNTETDGGITLLVSYRRRDEDGLSQTSSASSIPQAAQTAAQTLVEFTADDSSQRGSVVSNMFDKKEMLGLINAAKASLNALERYLLGENK